MTYYDDEPGWSDVRSNHNHIDIIYYQHPKDGRIMSYEYWELTYPDHNERQDLQLVPVKYYGCDHKGDEIWEELQ